MTSKVNGDRTWDGQARNQVTLPGIGRREYRKLTSIEQNLHEQARYTQRALRETAPVCTTISPCVPARINLIGKVGGWVFLDAGADQRQAGSVTVEISSQRQELRDRALERAVRRRRERGFSLVELLVSVIILVILAAIAVPTLMRAYRSYQLGDAASRLSGMMKTTRFAAIQRNAKVNCLVQQNGAWWTVWTDLDGDNIAQSTEPQILVGGIVQMLDAGSVPPPDAIVTALTAAAPALNVLSPGNATVGYDQRGARYFPPPSGATVDVLYLGNTAIPDFGFRAIVLLPSGTVQVWQAGPGGPWQRIS